MGELDERRWSVLSERDCEASSLTYDEATLLVRQLTGQRVNGLCIITDEAARRMTYKEPVSGSLQQSTEMPRR